MTRLTSACRTSDTEGDEGSGNSVSGVAGVRTEPKIATYLSLESEECACVQSEQVDGGGGGCPVDEDEGEGCSSIGMVELIR
jgi:hypothetical protein